MNGLTRPFMGQRGNRKFPPWVGRAAPLREQRAWLPVPETLAAFSKARSEAWSSRNLRSPSGARHIQTGVLRNPDPGLWSKWLGYFDIAKI